MNNTHDTRASGRHVRADTRAAAYMDVDRLLCLTHEHAMYCGAMLLHSSVRVRSGLMPSESLAVTARAAAGSGADQPTSPLSVV